MTKKKTNFRIKKIFRILSYRLLFISNSSGVGARFGNFQYGTKCSN
jgi:hypothetical protein